MNKIKGNSLFCSLDQEQIDQIGLVIDCHSIITKTDLKGRITYVNDKFCEISGFSHEEVLGKDHRIINSGHHPKSFFEDMWDSLFEGKIWKGEIKNKTKEGDFYWVESTIAPVKDSSGKISEFIAVRTDITPLKNFVELSNEIQEMGNIGGWTLDVKSNTVKWTEQTFRIHEIPETECIPTQEAINFYAPHERERISSLVTECITTGIPYSGEFEFRTAKGRDIWVRAMGQGVKDNNGEVIKLVGSFQDITEQKNHQLQLQESVHRTEILNKLLKINSEPKEDLNTLLKKALEIVVAIPWLSLTNKGGVFLTEGNVLKLKVSHHLGQKIEGLCAKVECGSCLCGRALAQKETIHASCVDENHEVTFEGISPHGHYNVPIKNGDEVIGVIVLYLAHGHRRSQAEVEFLENCAQIFSLIITGYRSELELIRSRAEALSAERAKSEFLANMSHEIRSPLNGMLGMAQLLKAPNLTEDQQDMLKTILNSGESLLTIVNDILDFAKIESGKLTFEDIDFNLEEILDESVSLFKFDTQKKNIEITQVYDLGEKLLIGDATRIRQIIVNLISNAVKFTIKGQIRIKAKLYENSVMISVTDTGVGISALAQKQLFKAFSQADNTVTRKFGGSGLGLAITKRLVELMGGKIHLKSKLNMGTTFMIDLPIKVSSSKIPTKKLGDVSDFEIMADDFPHKILLVEDNIVNQKIAKKMLEKKGYKVDIANNGLDAVSMVESQKDYTLIFMDMQMPIMDGVTATKKILNLKLDNMPAIVAMTANVFAEDKAKCANAGMVDFIPKPIKREELRRVLAQYSNSSSQKVS